jgi:hypothetical protein
VLPPTQRFKDLVERSNVLLNTNPATAKNGDQRFFWHGVEWAISEINDLADDFTECTGQLKNLIHNLL